MSLLTYVLFDITTEAGPTVTGDTLKTRMHRDEAGIAQCSGYAGVGNITIQGRLSPDAPWESVMGDADPTGDFSGDGVKLGILIMPEMRAYASGISVGTMTAKIHLME